MSEFLKCTTTCCCPQCFCERKSILLFSIFPVQCELYSRGHIINMKCNIFFVCFSFSFIKPGWKSHDGCVVLQVSQSGWKSFPHTQTSHPGQRDRCSVGVPPQPHTYMTPKLSWDYFTINTNLTFKCFNQQPDCSFFLSISDITLSLRSKPVVEVSL